ncbi:MAG TPA: hypothetical protein DEB31_10225 [Clostridiales bacterium]|nr:hypothetical protein [Clostridiales bacterium]
MEATSEKWRNNQQEPITSEGFVEVLYEISDPDLPEARATSNHELYISTMPDMLNPPLIDEVEREVTPYATLEHNLWLLDGSKPTVPDNGPDEEYSGYISEGLCDENGDFTINPKISIVFEDIVRILSGVTIAWSTAHGDYPARFRVVLYAGNNLRASKEMDNSTGATSIVEFEMTDFDRVDIEVIRWANPYRRARIEKIYPGIRKVYTKSDLLKFNCSQSIDPLSAELPKYEVAFEVNNIDGTFNPQNNEGLSKYMMERQQLSTRYGFRLDDEIEWIPGGVYYLSDWSAPQNGLSASFKARDLLGFMDANYYKGTFADQGASLYDLAKAVLQDADLPKHKTGVDPWVLDEALRDFTTTAPLPICSRGECLQMIANAACCTVFFSRDGILHIAPLGDSSETLKIHDRNSYSKPEISLTKPVKQIDVSMYSFTAEDREKELYEGTLEVHPGENVFIIEYSNAARTNMASIQVTGNGVTLNQAKTMIYAQSCELVLNSGNSGTTECSIIITGTVMKSTAAIVTIPNLEAGETQPLKNALITRGDHARVVGEWIKRHINNRKSLSVDWRADPRLDAGDIIRVGEPEKNVRVTSSDFSFSGAFKGKIEGVEI